MTILGVTASALFVAVVLHLTGVPGFEPVVAVPVTAVVAMCAMGVLGRFVPAQRARLVRMVPARLPARTAIVWVTGALELLGGIGVLVPQTRAAAAVCLALLLVCVFPANVVDVRAAARSAPELRAALLRRALTQAGFVALCVWTFVLAAQPR